MVAKIGVPEQVRGPFHINKMHIAHIGEYLAFRLADHLTFQASKLDPRHQVLRQAKRAVVPGCIDGYVPNGGGQTAPQSGAD